ncbi:MAG TPA: YetF domain-containing protein [Cryomorphaceae bacterium]|nr:YetF domain-containing protein [Cryomorphaceae bacterium]
MKWIYASDDPLWQTIVGAFLLLIAVLIFTRLVGLRSFAKFTVFDFAFTVAIGSIVSSTLTSSTTIVHGSVAIGALLVATYVASALQKNFPTVGKIASNTPVLLMEGSQILEHNMKKAQISRSQLYAKLREANVLNFSQVRAVVLENTGDISVLHSSDASEELVKEILQDVKR